MNITISSNANPNYLAKVVQVKGLRKHPNAERLQTVLIDFQNVITGLDTKDGDTVVFFPLESQINTNFLSFTNSFHHKELNKDQTQTGFFDDKGRVKAVKLRGERSMGYIVPIKAIEDFVGSKLENCVGKEFDTIGDILMVQKYIVPVKGSPQSRQGKKPKVSRLIDGQVHLHVDTENLRKNAYKISPDDTISVTYKVHGTSGWVSNVLVKRKLGIIEKMLRMLGVKIVDTEYDYVYGSRKVVKNSNMVDGKTLNHFYGSDIWGTAKDELKEFIPKGYTFYFEIVGFMPSGLCIQKSYDYGCAQGQHAIYVYRITFTNADGIVSELSTDDIREWANKVGFNYVPHFFTGRAKDLFSEAEQDEAWTDNFMAELEKKYTDKNCFMCRNVCPEEGIVLRKEGVFQFETFKLKSFKFLEYETKLLDEGQADIESQIDEEVV